MGKYMRKAKLSGEVALMEVSAHQTPLGVRTRSRTLALQRLQKPSSSSSPTRFPDPSLAYLELRSRRLEKPPPPRPKEEPKERGGAKPAAPKPVGRGVRSANSGSAGSSSVARLAASAAAAAAEEEEEEEEEEEVEASFGENVLDVEARDRDVRESTPCSLIRDSDAIGTPSSTTRPTNSSASNRRERNLLHRAFPTALEMEEFFADAERLQQQIFMEKYNFDPINDYPLPG
ncbi:Cyclin-dependent kinase inhibitor 5, partial [Ananas comosus]